MATERIGIMGGSFNPIHRRHMDMAASALEEGQLSRVLFIPTGNPPHKHSGLEPAGHRFEMTRLAVMSRAGFTASRMELDRAGVIYTVDTLTQLHRQFPGAELFYIIGEDTLLDLPNWRNPDRVFSLCSFLVCARSTQDASAHPLCKALEARGACFHFLTLPPVDISSTAIRQALAAGQEPSELAPQVMAYIQLMGLYGTRPMPAGGAAMYPRLRQALSDKRLLHSLLVTSAARQLAREHHLSENAAALAGLLHDCAKCMPLSQMQLIAQEHRLLLDKETLQSGNLLHGPVGAAVAETDYGVTDPNVLSAIACHTTGKVGMLPLDMAVFLADKTEPSRRPYPALAQVRSLAHESLIAAMGCCLQNTLEYVSAQGAVPHAITRQVLDWLQRLEPKPPPGCRQQDQRSEIHE